MSQDREKMIEALQQVITPRLRDAGFRGSFPHFTRVSLQRIGLLTFQFDKQGGGFVIEIARYPPEGFSTYWGKHIPPNKVQARDMHPDQRPRLQPRKGSSMDEWFRFDQTPSDRQKSIFAETAEAVLPFLNTAEEYWKTCHPNEQTK